MAKTIIALGLGLGVAMLAGCAGPVGEGRAALSQGRYGEAASRFESVLAQDPQRLSALVGLGVARYKLGALDETVSALDRAVAQAPAHATARLYLGLAHLRAGADGAAEEHLKAFVGLNPGPRLAGHVDRALRMLRGDPLPEETRTFIAASLEDQSEWARELRETQLALRDAQTRYLLDDRFYLYGIRRCRC